MRDPSRRRFASTFGLQRRRLAANLESTRRLTDVVVVQVRASCARMLAGHPAEGPCARCCPKHKRLNSWFQNLCRMRSRAWLIVFEGGEVGFEFLHGAKNGFLIWRFPVRVKPDVL